MRISAVVMTSLLVGLLWAQPSAAQNKAELLSREGFELIDRQRFDQAIKKFEKATKAGGGFEPHLGIAVACNRLGDHGRALQHALQAVPLAATDLERTISNNQLGIASFNHLREEQGKEIAARGFRRGNSDPEPLKVRDWTVAEKAFRTVIELDPVRYPIAHLNLAQVLGYQRRYQEAAAELEIWQGSNPPPPPPYLQRTIQSLRCSAALAESNPDSKLVSVGPNSPGVSKPQKISDSSPRYTQSAMLEETQGSVVIEGVIDRSGRVACMNVLAGLPNGLTESALESVEQWKFDPAVRDGEPLAVIYELTVSFRLSKKKKLSDTFIDG